MLPCLRSVRRVLVTSILLLGYLTTVAEEAIPDDHDWHRASGGTVTATASDAPAQPGPGVPAHGVHVCHDGHQHTSALSLGATGRTQVLAARIVIDPEPVRPRVPPPHPFFRPPIG